MNPRLYRVLLKGSAFVVLVLFCELTFRLGLKIGFYFPFWRPDRVMAERYYRDAYRIRDSTITQTDGYYDILLLGGSVIADEWHSTVGRRLQDSLKTRLGNSKIRYWNAANLGQSSGDNLTKYGLLENQRFDLVIYYEAINETRLNNIPRKYFRNDYSHYHWYDEVKLVREHPELTFTVIPFAVHLILERLKAALGIRRYIHERPTPTDQQHGGDLKTPPVYRKNLLAIKDIARTRHERLLLVNFTYYIPETWRMSHFTSGVDYSQCGLWSPIETWGTVLNVEKGILAHRYVMAELAATNPEVDYFDMLTSIPQTGHYFCDICHLTEEGSALFVSALTKHIVIAQDDLLASLSASRH